MTVVVAYRSVHDAHEFFLLLMDHLGTAFGESATTGGKPKDLFEVRRDTLCVCV